MTKAFVIEGKMRAGDAFQAVVGVAFFPDGTKGLTGNMLESMGFVSARRDKNLRFEAVNTNGGAPPIPTVFLFNKNCASGVVTRAEIGTGGLLLDMTQLRANHPSRVIPAITGAAAVRIGLANTVNAPAMNDFPRRKGSGQQFQQRIYAR
jgi:hypothetical protein